MNIHFKWPRVDKQIFKKSNKGISTDSNSMWQWFCLPPFLQLSFLCSFIDLFIHLFILNKGKLRLESDLFFIPVLTLFYLWIWRNHSQWDNQYAQWFSPRGKGNSRLLGGLRHWKIRSYNNSAPYMTPYMMARWLPQQIPCLNFLVLNPQLREQF